MRKQTIHESIESAKYFSKRSGGKFPPVLKSGGKIWTLVWTNFSNYYVCHNAPKEWKLEKVEIVGEKSLRPYWAATDKGIDAIRELGEKLGRNRIVH